MSASAQTGMRGRVPASSETNGSAGAAVAPSSAEKEVPKWTSTVSGAALGIALILFGCCANVMTLEIITQRDPGAGNLITFAQFLLIASEGVINHWRWPFGLTPRLVPLSTYAKITAIFFLTSLLNNKALDYQISIPVHTVFRSSGLCATLLLGRFGYRLRYPRHQVLACVLVTVGILAVTVMDAGKGKRGAGGAGVGLVKGCCGDDGVGGIDGGGVLSNSSVVGINQTVANAALFLSAYLGHEQDRTYKQYGKGVWKEVMFYSHLLALPAFTFVAPDILRHIQLLASLPPPALPLPLLPSVPPLTPPLLLVLLLNLLFQSVCIRGVYLLTTHSNTLTCNLLLTLRKLLSLLLSVTYFGNSFNVWQWCGSVLVFLGVCCYSQNPFGGRQTWADMIKSPLGSERSTPEKIYRALAGGGGVGGRVGVGQLKEGVVGDEIAEQVVEEKVDAGVRRRVKAQ